MADVNPSQGDASSAGPRAYVGPRPFRAGETLYCRDREAVQLVSLLVSQRLVLLHSPSGAGKTSLIHAKIVPAMQKRRFEVPMLSGGEQGVPQPAVIRLNREPQPNDPPGSNRYLLSTLSSLESRRAASDQRRTSLLSPLNLDDYLSHEFPAASRAASGDRAEKRFRPLLLVFDQFEELLTLDPTDQPAKQQFIRELAQALEEHGRWALFAIRDDYLGSLEPYLPALPTRLSATYHLDLLRADAAAGAIVEPARSAGVEFEDGLVDKLIDELRQVQVQLPDGTFGSKAGPYIEPVQLQVVCQSLWHERTDLQWIRHEDLETLGGGRGSGVDEVLATYYARNVANAATAGGVRERLVREWFGRHLITSQGVRRPVLEGEALTFGLTRECLRALDKAFLIRRETLHGAQWYELAHDRLVGPVQNNNQQWRVESLSTFQRHAELWVNNGRPADLLAGGTALQEANRWVAYHADELTLFERDFLAGSRKAEAGRRRRRRLMISCATALTLLATLAIVFGIRSNWARHEALRAKQAAAENQRAAQASAKQAQTHLARAEQAAYASKLSLAKNAWNDFDAGLAWRHLNSCQWDLRGWEHDYLYTKFTQGSQILATGHHGFFTIAFSPDGRRLAAAAGDQTIQVWNTEDGENVLAFPSPLRTTSASSNIVWRHIAFDPQGRRLACADSDGTIKLYDAENGDELLSFKGHPRQATCVVFSPDGGRLASSSADTTVKIWRAASGEELITLKGHEDLVYYVDFSPNGSQVASASADGTVRTWDTETGDCVQEFTGHRDKVYSVAYHPDGHRLASGSFDDTVKVWDIKSGDCVFTLDHYIPQSVVFSRDGRWLASAGADQAIKVWDAEDGERRFTLPGHSATVYQAVFSPKGRRLASVGEDRTVRLWDLRESARDGFSVKDHAEASWIFACSPDGRRIALVARDESVAIWDVPTGREIAPLSDEGIGLIKAVFSPDGDRLAGIGNDEKIVVWDASTGRGLHTLKEHTARVKHVAFCHDGRWLASASEDQTAKVWDVNTGKCLHTLRRHEAPVDRVVFGPRGRRLVTEAHDTTRVWDPRNGQFLFRLGGQPVGGKEVSAQTDRRPAEDSLVGQTGGGEADAISSVVFSLDGNWLAGICGQHTVIVWEAEEGRRRTTLSGHLDPVARIALSRDGGLLACASDKNDTVVVWDVEQQRQAYLLQEQNVVHQVVFSPDGGRIVTVTQDGTVKVWDARSGAELITLSDYSSFNNVYFCADGLRLVAESSSDVKFWDATERQHEFTIQGLTLGQENRREHGIFRSVYGVAYSPDSGLIASGGDDEKIRVWDAKKGHCLFSVDGHAGGVHSVAFSPDSRRLASTGDDGIVKIWDAANGKCLREMPGKPGLNLAVAFSPDGKQLANATPDRRVSMWDAESGELLYTTVAQPTVVTSVAFSPDGRRFVTACGNQKAEVWSAKNGASLLTLKGHQGKVFSAAFRPDGRRIATAGSRGTLKFWDATSGREVRSVPGNFGQVESIAFSPDGHLLAGAAIDGTVRVWSVVRGKEVMKLSETTGSQFCVAFSPDGSRLVSGSRHGAIKMWRISEMLAESGQDTDKKTE